MRPILLLAAAAAATWLVPAPASAVVLAIPQLRTQSQATFDYRGTHYEDLQQSVGVTSAETQVLLGNANMPEVRTAARIGADELAVNIRIDGHSAPGITAITRSESSVTYNAELTALTAPEHLFARFFLPAGYVENLNNGEFQFTEVTSVVQASIATRLCTSGGGCGSFDEQFFFQALLETSLRDELHDAQARGQAGLDLTTLRNATFTDTGPGFLRTRNLGFTDFEGVLDLGVLGAGQTLEFEYHMFARSEGDLTFSSYGIAAINDPFTFPGDPVRRHPTISFFSVPVDQPLPEPPPAGLLAVALCAAALRRRR